MHYNRCPKLCNEVITGLLSALNDARKTDPAFVAGGPFNVVMVSIDPREAPTVVRKNRELFLREYDGRNPDQPGVWFLTASEGQGTDVLAADRKVHQLADAVGFRYQMRFRNQDFLYQPDEGVWRSADGKANLPPEPRNYDFGHASGLTVLTPAGTVSKYLLGINYSARDVRLSLVEASDGKIGTWSDAVSQYCFTYDSVKGHYRLTMRYLAWASVPFVLLVGFLTARTVRSARSEPTLAPGEGPPVPPAAA
jgi:protein SCO1/2